MGTDFSNRLIKQVKKYECLYDATSPEYGRNTFKKAVWEKISKELKTRESLCKTRWRSLRDRYKRDTRLERIKNLDSKPQLPKKKWHLAESMSFLDDVKQCRKLDSSDEDDEEVSIDNDENSWPALPSPDDTQIDDFIQEDESESNSCPPADKACLVNRTEESIKPAFTEVMAKCGDGDNVEVRPYDPLAARNSTLLLFETLAHKVIAAGLPTSDVDAIEINVASFVYEEISNRRRNLKQCQIIVKE